MFGNKEKYVILDDEDILHSLNYNAIIQNRTCILNRNKILYYDFKIFNYKNEIEEFYSKEDGIVTLNITKLDKFKQLLNNITFYLEIPISEILYKYEKNIVYSNIYKLIDKYNIDKKFYFISYFQNYDWITNMTNFK